MSSSRRGESSNKKNKGKEKESARKRIVWFIGRPKKSGEISHAHGTTSLGGADVRDDEHVTIFADRQPGGSADADFEFEGHIYLNLYEDGTPWRLLHPDEFEFDGARAPIVLYDEDQNSYPYYLGDAYYQYYESLIYQQYYTPHQEAENVDSYAGAAQSATGEGEPVHVKAKRKRRKGKGKAT
ncbi:hypothetical protein VFPFJ_00007 [Purpureocillium lilacinum]|uniref:Uncharacterized protein n=1 Tax=Purpureocillium lilacinum TaxID=33203 RepID=A0A179HWS4_PURLI|nr:hypothetical protein VFPFJ_00007 [Purpureocillium lilacinum]OAQ93899.1 hypothetical protein VFPFJ_00007 [Purpureocillium lilacinum]